MAKKRERVFALSAAVLFLVTSLGFSVLVIYQMAHQKSQDQAQQNQAQAQNSSKGKQLDNYTPVSSVPQLQKIDQTVGTGTEVQEGDAVTVHYTLALAKDGKIIETSKDTGQPVTLTLAQGQVIDGWVQGVPGMKVGGSRRLLIPAALAYGDKGAPNGGIPPNTDLVFDIEVVNTAPASETQQQPPQQ